MPVTIRKCSVAEIVNAPNFGLLADEYAKESAIEGIPSPGLDFERYSLLEKSGYYHAYGAFDDELIGFIGVLCAPTGHYGNKEKPTRLATSESFFVTKPRRGSGAGLKLRDAARDCGKNNDCSALMIIAKPGSDLDLMLAMKKTVEHTNNVYCERL